MRPVAWWEGSLWCPACRASSLERDDGSVRCAACGTSYPADLNGRLDLRWSRCAALALEASPPMADPLEGTQIGRPEISFEGHTEWRAPSELLSVLGSVVPPGGSVMDAGCGGAAIRRPAEAQLGLRYVGVDIDSSEADLLADLHDVPFRDGAFDAVVSYAVLSLCRYPPLALSEMARVLRPGGLFVGTVGSCEPFVGDFVRMSHAGILDAVRTAGLVPDRIWACRDALEALGSYIGPYPAVVKVGLRALARLARVPVLAPRRFMKERSADRALRELATAGSFGVVAFKPGRAEG